MRACLLETTGGPEVLALKDVPMPEPGPGQVRVQVAYAAMNPLDAHARAGRIDWGVPGLPFVLGYEYAGRIDAVGDGVDAARVGQRVSVAGQWGGFGDYAVAPADTAVPVPDALDWPLAAAYYTTTLTAWHLVNTVGRVQRDMVVVIHAAAGAVGLLTTQIAKEKEAVVIGLAGSRDKIDWAARFGADHWLNYRQADWPDRVRELTDGVGAELIIDGVAGPHAPRNLAALAPLGTIIYLGAAGGLAPDIDVSQLIGQSAGVRGFVVYHAMARTRGAELPEIHDAVASGRWDLGLGAPVALDDVADLHRRWEDRTLVGRSVVRVGGDI